VIRFGQLVVVHPDQGLHGFLHAGQLDQRHLLVFAENRHDILDTAHPNIGSSLPFKIVPFIELVIFVLQNWKGGTTKHLNNSDV
jgi:hypothetical protein